MVNEANETQSTKLECGTGSRVPAVEVQGLHMRRWLDLVTTVNGEDN